MNKVKRGFQLSAGIIGIGFSIFVISLFVYTMFITTIALGEWAVFFGFAYIIMLFIVMVGIANLILCSFLCRNKYTLGIVIPTILLNIILLIAYFGGDPNYNWVAVFPAIVAVLLFITMFIRNTPRAKVPTAVPPATVIIDASATPVPPSDVSVTIAPDTPATIAEEKPTGKPKKVAQPKKAKKEDLTPKPKSKKSVKKPTE